MKIKLGGLTIQEGWNKHVTATRDQPKVSVLTDFYGKDKRVE